jgi:Uma2 family endonuclease
MASPALQITMSEDAYFELLEKSIDKYEYWNGVAVLMAGAQPNHVRIEGNIFGELFQKLRGKECRPLVSNQAVKLAGSRGYVFPDVTVVCGKPEYVIKRGIGCLLNPVVVAEVLSPSTASTDETEKLLEYTGIKSIREYLVVSSDRMALKIFARKSGDETWSARAFRLPADSVELESCGCSLTLEEMYAGLEFPAPIDFGGE